jgi:hypothetical protein
MSKPAIAIIAFVAVFLCLLVWSTFHGPRYRVQVCMDFKGRSACRTVSGKSGEAALRGAVDNACADLVSGVTDTMACGQAQPQSVKWLNRPDR